MDSDAPEAALLPGRVRLKRNDPVDTATGPALPSTHDADKPI